MPYEQAKNWRDTQTDIAKLFSKYGIGDTQWSVSDGQKKAALSFIKDFPAKLGPATRENGYQRATIEPARRLAVRIDIPIAGEGKDRNTAFRTLYWYLKSKLEAITFKFQDGTELFNFEREFFGHTMITDAEGRPSTAFDAFKNGNVALAAPRDVIALSGGR